MLSSRLHKTSRPRRDDPAPLAQVVPSTVATGIDTPGILSAPNRVCQGALDDAPALRVYDNDRIDEANAT